jgi:hypothetical protein
MYSEIGHYDLHSRFPDSDISGSTPVSGSPKLFAAVHVLLRLLAPRHPPCALCSLTVSLRHVSQIEIRVQNKNPDEIDLQIYFGLLRLEVVTMLLEKTILHNYLVFKNTASHSKV